MWKYKLVIIAMPLLLTACQSGDQEPVKEVVRPVKSMIIGSSEIGGMRNFPGVVDANQKADLSFRVPGKVAKLLVKEGDKVEQGQVLAELDPTDFQINVNNRQATFNRARADYNRAKKLVGKGHISRMDYDRLEADYKSRGANLERARTDLSYTVLKAPFTGEIAQRFVEIFEEVRAKITVLALRDNSSLEVKFNIPENIVLSIRKSKQGDIRNKIQVWASFEAVPGKRFPLTFKEAATKADPQTQTFQVTHVMPAPDGLTILPGMTATVTVDLSRHLHESREEIYYLPVSAVAGDAKLDAQIWIVNEQTMTVAPKKVRLGNMQGSTVEVLDGIQGGERVVTAGARYMAEGMKVSLMKQSEQAIPRQEDINVKTEQK